MTVKARDSGWQATIHHKGRRWRRQFADHQSAKIWEAQSSADVLRGEEPSRPNEPQQSALPRTLGEMIEYTGTHEWVDKKSGKHLLRNAQLVGEMIGLNVLMKDVDILSLDNLVVSLREMGNSNGTINRKLASLSKCLTTALHLGVIDRKPRIKRLREPVNRIRWYTDTELDEIVGFCKDKGNDQFGLWIRFQADTGMRVSETRGLLWGDIQNSVAILADTKSDKPRGVPLTAAAQEAVRSGGGRNGPFDWATTAYIRKWWNLIRIHMNWDDKQAVPHALRHTFVSRLVQKNIPLLTIKELAGHRSIDITLRYAHLAPHNLTEAISALEPSFQHD